MRERLLQPFRLDPVQLALQTSQLLLVHCLRLALLRRLVLLDTRAPHPLRLHQRHLAHLALELAAVAHFRHAEDMCKEIGRRIEVLDGERVPFADEVVSLIVREVHRVGPALRAGPEGSARLLRSVSVRNHVQDVVAEVLHQPLEREPDAAGEVDRAARLLLQLHNLHHRAHRREPLVVRRHRAELLKEIGLVLAERLVLLGREDVVLGEELLLRELDAVQREVREASQRAHGDPNLRRVDAVVVRPSLSWQYHLVVALRPGSAALQQRFSVPQAAAVGVLARHHVVERVPANVEVLPELIAEVVLGGGPHKHLDALDVHRGVPLLHDPGTRLGLGGADIRVPEEELAAEIRRLDRVHVRDENLPLPGRHSHQAEPLEVLTAQRAGAHQEHIEVSGFAHKLGTEDRCVVCVPRGHRGWGGSCPPYWQECGVLVMHPLINRRELSRLLDHLLRSSSAEIRAEPSELGPEKLRKLPDAFSVQLPILA
mmetsp:Transcript_56864/g.116405  ORF Transcript_56864/g.116405 Transcript_56864/m.116405 type:complete len:485 (-) Transcript_56864:1510-2964(-)